MFVCPSDYRARARALHTTRDNAHARPKKSRRVRPQAFYPCPPPSASEMDGKDNGDDDSSEEDDPFGYIDTLVSTNRYLCVCVCACVPFYYCRFCMLCVTIAMQIQHGRPPRSAQSAAPTQSDKRRRRLLVNNCPVKCGGGHTAHTIKLHTRTQKRRTRTPTHVSAKHVYFQNGSK